MATKRRRKPIKSETPEVKATIALPPVEPSSDAPGAGVAAQPLEKVVRVNARTAGTLCDQFRAGGEAFEAWCRHRNIDTRAKRTLADWGPLLTEFASRSVFGLRRSQGTTHSAKR